MLKNSRITTLMDELDNPFWQFSLRIYRCEEVKTSCLNLQNRTDINVNLLLLCLWLSYFIDPIQYSEFTQVCHSVRVWQNEVTLPLRKVRQILKEDLEKKWISNFYQLLLNDEITSEAYQQHYLFSLFADRLRLPPRENKDLALCYLHWLFEITNIPLEEALDLELREFIKKGFQAYNQV